LQKEVPKEWTVDLVQEGPGPGKKKKKNSKQGKGPWAVVEGRLQKRGGRKRRELFGKVARKKSPGLSPCGGKRGLYAVSRAARS